MAIGAIYYIGQNNSSKVEEYFTQNECKKIYNYKTQYKALCKNGIVLINDYFIVDFSSNENIIYKDIGGIEKDEKKVYIQYDSLAFILEFKKEKDSKDFFINLQKRVNP